jgi:hypothetical protein
VLEAVVVVRHFWYRGHVDNTVTFKLWWGEVQCSVARCVLQ